MRFDNLISYQQFHFYHVRTSNYACDHSAEGLHDAWQRKRPYNDGLWDVGKAIDTRMDATYSARY